MSDARELQRALERAEKEVGYLKRTIARMEKRLERQEKLDDMNRYQTKWAIRQVEAARRQAEQANHAKTEFLANMSHEIRTPLNIVLGMGELLAGTELDDSQRHYLQSLRLSSEHLLKLIEDILEFSRIEAGSVEIDPAPFDLRQLLVGVEAMGAHMASEKGLVFELACDRSLEPNRVGDSRKIKQILINLLGNSVKFTDRGKVGLSVTGLQGDEREHVVFTVSDTGIGIPENKQGVIFQRFAQIGPDGLKDKHGVGLGLAICERLVTAMGGRIDIDSEVGRGSCFSVTVRLPFAEAAAPAVREAPFEHLHPDLFDLPLLVVDDITLNFEVIKNYFMDLPVRLDYADNGKTALERFAMRSYGAVLIDIRMPVMGGLEAVHNMRVIEEQRGVERTPVIAMTAHVFPEQTKTYLEAGFDEVLIKPFSGKDLLSALRRQLRRDPAGAQLTGAHGRRAAEKGATPDGLDELLPEVYASISKEIGVMKQALHESDYGTLKQTCHAVKGVAGFYGLNGLSELLEHLEGSAARREYRTACALADALGRHVAELRLQAR